MQIILICSTYCQEVINSLFNGCSIEKKQKKSSDSLLTINEKLIKDSLTFVLYI